MTCLCVCKLLLVTSSFLSHSYGFNLDIYHPIVYEDPLKEEGSRGSYFGFSVILHSGSTSKGYDPWVQIGAPRGNVSTLLPDVVEPGVVFRCPIAGSCQRVMLDDDKGKEHQNAKNGAWIGGVMDIQERLERIAVCGHRWKDDITRKGVEMMIGVCYWSKTGQNISSAVGVKKLLPLNDPGKYITELNNQNIYNYGVGQAGISVHISPRKNNPTILIGAPGVYLWKGTGIRYVEDNESHKSRWYIIDPETKLKNKRLRYLGYQITSGEFHHNKTYYVAGSPRGEGYKGNVLIYEYEYTMNEAITLVGEQTGEYFGASLAVADINGDKLDDLVIGAPHYTKFHDEGRIYLFIANSQKRMFKNAQKIHGNIMGANFGTAIAAVGDLDKDGYADIVVGAPFENGRGAIYVYNGGKNGLVMSQKIVTADIAPNIIGFGISIARAVDIDTNKYADIAVGAFSSGHVVLLRSYPVVTLLTYSNTSIYQLQGDETKFFLSVCFSYTGEDVPSQLNIEREIILDEEKERATITGERKPYTRRLTIPISGYCENLTISLLEKQFKLHLLEPITITVNQELIADRGNRSLVLIKKDKVPAKEELQQFKKFVPVVNEKQSIKQVLLSIPIKTGCGDDNICKSDLHLHASFLDLTSGTFIIGSKTKLGLQVNLTNLGEPAYSAGITVTIPFPLDLAKGYSHCQEHPSVDGLQLTCDLGNPLRKENEKSITLLLDMSGVKVDTEQITFNISTFTKSEDRNALNSFQQLPLKMITDADVIINGKSEEDVYAYYKSNEIKFTQIYEIQKIGWSPIEVVDVNFDIPIEWKKPKGKNIVLLKLNALKAFMNNRQLFCTSETISFYDDEELVEVEQEDQIRAKREVSERENTLKEYIPPANRTLFLNCSTPNVVCGSVKCTAGPFDSSSQTSVPMVMKMTLQSSDELGPIMGKKDIIYVSTRGSVTIKQPDNLKSTTGRHSIILSSIFIGSVKKEVVATWIYALAIIAGILLFMFLVLGLVKAGFFERKKKDELKKLRVADAMDEFNFQPASKNKECYRDDVDDDDDDDHHEYISDQD